METFNNILNAVNGVIWHDYVLYIVLGVGVLFTIWSGFCQYRALTHGVAVTRGKYDDKNDPGAINHFQALSAALSATVGRGERISQALGALADLPPVEALALGAAEDAGRLPEALDIFERFVAGQGEHAEALRLLHSDWLALGGLGHLGAIAAGRA